MKRQFRLYRGGELLGLVDHTEDDFPTHIGRFEPTEAFESVRSLFTQELALLNANRLDEWRKVREQIECEELLLEPIGLGKEERNPLIHIDGEKVWWR
jgi:hypothetical protein